MVYSDHGHHLDGDLEEEVRRNRVVRRVCKRKGAEKAKENCEVKKATEID